MWWAALLNTVLGSLSSGVAAATGAYESIASVTTTSSQTTITFSSIPNTYQHLQIRGIARNNAGSGTDNLYMRFNGDSGDNYTTHWMSGDGSTRTTGEVNPWSLQLVGFIPASGTTANAFAATITDIHDYCASGKNKTVRYFTGNDRNGSGHMFIGSSSWMNTSAISSITIVCSNDFAVGTVISLYGIKGA